MKQSTLFGRTLREAPGEVETEAHQLVLRAGLVRSLQAGSYALLPMGMRVARRIETIMHEEMSRIGAQEFRTPVIQSSEPWEQTGRYVEYGPLMLRLVDRGQRSLLVAPTHEEAVAELARREISSYRDLPVLLYQIHTKYRDELRARYGLSRMREFTMLDAYSLDQDYAGLDTSFDLLALAFERIFQRCGVRVVAVTAGSGEMGGGEAREYMALSKYGEDTIVTCPRCEYAANLEVATSAHTPGALEEAPEIDMVATPGCATIADLATFLDIPRAGTAKAVFFDTPERGLLFVVIRGDLEVNETKLRSAAGVSALTPARDEQIRTAGAVPGYASPIGLQGVPILVDHSVIHAGALVAGANREGYHLRHVLYGRDWQGTQVVDIATVREGDPCAQCAAPLRLQQTIEVGHIFKLGTRYTDALGATFLDANGEAQPVVMGSYGIGVERLMQVIIEQHHDENGITWPPAVAPFDVHLLALGASEEIQDAAAALYHMLGDAGIRTLYDDRDERAGVKFNDADLLGIPVRLVISQRLLREDEVEIKPRTGEASRSPRTAVVVAVREALAQRP